MALISKFLARMALGLVAGIACAIPAVADDASSAQAMVVPATPIAKSKAKRTHSAPVAPRRVVNSVTKPVVRRAHGPVRADAGRSSFGQQYGLHRTSDSLDLKSSVALVLDAETDEVLFSKNPQAVLPIASLTKLMTALVVAEAQLPMAEMITITDDDIDTEKGSRSRLKVGTTLSREEMLHLALMSSENRAAHALGRAYPGGLPMFVEVMNQRARDLGMNDTRYVEPTGLSSRNQSSAHDLAILVKAAESHQMIRDFSTSPEFAVALGKRSTQFRTTNALVRSPAWDIALQKTGYITEAGRCLVMQARMAGRKLTMVFLDSAGKYSRIADAERVRRWVSAMPVAAPTAVQVKTSG